MTRYLAILLAGILTLGLAACQEKTEQAAQPQPAAEQQQQGFAGTSGTVVESMNAAGYTYVQVDTGSEKIWAAAPEFQVQVGDAVAIPQGMPMQNYHSKTLNRDFDVVYFVDSVMVGGVQAAAATGSQMPEGHPQINIEAAAAESGVDLSDIAKAAGGKTVAEIYAEKDGLNGKSVEVRGKVVKFSPEIMGKNWIHLQDGTGGTGSNDLTVTTSGAAKVGDTVLVSGVLVTNKDFGYGYNYDVIIEDAKVTVE